MEEKGFCLKWEKFLDVCKGTFSQLLKNEQFADVTLFCESRLIKCHRLVLSASSQYFQNLLLELNYPNPVIAMHNVKLQDLLAIIKFIYTGEVTVSQEQLTSLVKLGEQLKVKGLGEDEEEEKIEHRPPSVNRPKKPVSPVEKQDSESTSVKRRRMDNVIGNGQIHFSACDEPSDNVADEASGSSYIPVKEEAEIFDLEPESRESISLDQDKDLDFSGYDEQEMIRLCGVVSLSGSELDGSHTGLSPIDEKLRVRRERDRERAKERRQQRTDRERLADREKNRERMQEYRKKKREQKGKSGLSESVRIARREKNKIWMREYRRRKRELEMTLALVNQAKSEPENSETENRSSPVNSELDKSEPAT